jgi:aryl-alcohol dehydrogenase-like predicted oxidoreductase
MQYTKLGRTGLDVSRLCLGCMTYGEPDRGAHMSGRSARRRADRS